MRWRFESCRRKLPDHAKRPWKLDLAPLLGFMGGGAAQCLGHARRERGNKPCGANRPVYCGQADIYAQNHAP